MALTAAFIYTLPLFLVKGCHALIVNIVHGHNQVRHMGSVSGKGNPLANVPDLRPAKPKVDIQKPIPKVKSIAPTDTDQGSNTDTEFSMLTRIANSIKLPHVGMFIAGAAFSSVSLFSALVATAMMILLISKRSIQPPQSKSHDLQPLVKQSKKTPIGGTLRLEEVSMLKNQKLQQKQSSVPKLPTPTPPSHRRLSHPHSVDANSVIPVYKRMNPADKTIDEEYAFRPYS